MVARLLVTGGLLWLLASRLDVARAAHILVQVSPPLLAAGLGLLGFAALLTAWRWHVILAAEAPSPGPAALSKLVFVGLFFNQVLPSAIGGDAVRAMRCRRLGIGLGSAVRSILLDRACGYAVFVLLYALSLPTLLHVLPDMRQRVAVVVIFAGAVFGAVALVLFDCLSASLLRLPLLRQIASLSGETRRLLGDRRRASLVFALSSLTVGLTIVTFKLLGDGLGNPLPLSSWTVVVPPVVMIQLFPVALAGWGVREVGIVLALSGFGVPAEAALAISLLFGLCQVAVALPGGLIWLADWDLSGVLRGAGAPVAGKPSL